MSDLEDVAPEPSRAAPTALRPAPARPVQAGKTKADRKRDREHNQLVEVLATPHGRAVVWRFLEFCNPYAANDKGTEYQRGVQEGQRRIGLRIITLIESADRLGYAKMIEDDANRQAHIDALELAIEIGEQQTKDAAEAKMGYWERFRRKVLRGL